MAAPWEVQVVELWSKERVARHMLAGEVSQVPRMEPIARLREVHEPPCKTPQAKRPLLVAEALQ